MRIRVLGSAAGGGVPQWNCACRNCAEARAGRLPSRRGAAVAVCADEERWIVVNASCDISRQFADAGSLHPAGVRSNPTAALLLTDANVDHTAGILEFRQAITFRIYSTDLVKTTLCAGPMFAQLADQDRQWLTFDAGKKVRVEVAGIGSLRIWSIAVPGLLPSYAGGQERAGATIAYLFEHGNARFVYAPVFLTVDDHLMRELEHADVVMLDGTFWSDHEMIELGLGARTSRAMGHVPISGAGGSMQAAATLRARHRYYTHINNSNPVLDPSSPQSAELRQAGFAVAHDDLEIEINGARTPA